MNDKKDNKLRATDTTRLNESQRLTLIRFAVTHGYSIYCQTSCLYRPLLMQDFERELEKAAQLRQDKIGFYKKLKEDYKAEKNINTFLELFFGSHSIEPTMFYKTMDHLISETEKNDIRKKYYIPVFYDHLNDDDLAFHYSLEPKVTFGGQDFLHEEFEIEFNKKIRDAFIKSFKKKVDQYTSYGVAKIGNLVYSSIEIFDKDKRLILRADDNRKIIEFNITETLYELLHVFEGKFERNYALLYQLAPR
jgi:hypothetical protein